MAIAVHSSTPAPTQSNVSAGGTIATSAITAPGNSLIVLGIAAAGLASGPVGPPDTYVTGVTGGGLTFTELAYAWTGADDYASIWCGYGSPAASSVFTAQFGSGNSVTQGCDLVPLVLTGAASTQTGGVATHPSGGNGTGTHQALESTSAATPFGITVAATAAGSLVLAVQSNFGPTTTPTPTGDQTISFNGHSSMCTLSGNGQWMQMEPTLTSGAGDVTIGYTIGGTSALIVAMCAAEILGATATTHTSSQSAGASFSGSQHKQINKLLIA